MVIEQRDTVGAERVASHFGPGVRDVAPFAHGEWSHAYAFRPGALERGAVRFSAFEEDFRKDRLAMRFAAPDLPIPAVFAIGPTEGGGFYAISQRVHGGYA